ncbi:MAG: tail fiber domain-containing protein [Chloracidobacterium sp.]|nr:tail fiber domain-containing protein [Chloracidobacterium sp.]
MPSSLRYKSNVEPYDRGLEVVRRLRPIAFQWNSGGLLDIGFAAEEVATVGSRSCDSKRERRDRRSQVQTDHYGPRECGEAAASGDRQSSRATHRVEKDRVCGKDIRGNLQGNK